jgi:hypothetical protein
LSPASHNLLRLTIVIIVRGPAPSKLRFTKSFLLSMFLTVVGIPAISIKQRKASENILGLLLCFIQLRDFQPQPFGNCYVDYFLYFIQFFPLTKKNRYDHRLKQNWGPPQQNQLTRFCPHCGRVLDENSRFCGQCANHYDRKLKNQRIFR